MEEQKKQNEWEWEWQKYDGEDEWLFHEWMHPVTLEDFRGKRVMDAGCGPGQHVSIAASVAHEVVGVDLNSHEIARERTAHLPNVKIMEGDIARISFDAPFDIVYCIGVIHHTDDPDATFRNLARLTAPGGRSIIWAYSHEGNALNRWILEPAKKYVLLALPKPALKVLATILTVLLYVPIYTIYLLPLRFLPFYEYFQNFRRLTFETNELNVFDKMNAPTTHFITRERLQNWFESNGYQDIVISPYKGVSWRGSGVKLNS